MPGQRLLDVSVLSSWRGRRTLLGIAAVLGGTTACSIEYDDSTVEPAPRADDAPKRSPAQPTTAAAMSVMASVRPNAAMVVAAYVDVSAPGSTSVVVHYGDDERYGRDTPALTPDAEGTVTAVLLGLASGATTHLSVEARGTRGRSVTTDDLRFEAAALPAALGLPSVTITTDDGTATGFTLQAVVAEAASATVLDRRGRVMWYRPTHGVGVIDRLPNGHFVVSQALDGAIEEVDLDGTLIRTWPAHGDVASGLDMHEFLPLPAGHAAVFRRESNAFDSTPYFEDGSRDAHRLDSALLDLAPDGAERRVWSTLGDVGIDDLTPDPDAGLDPLEVDMSHANSIDLAPDGNFIVSLRQVSQIVKIDHGTGRLLWRLGGARGDFQFLDDPQGGFSRQHDARWLPNGRLRVYDNGTLHTPPETRIVEYEIDESALTARQVYEYRHVPPLFSRVAGSARALPGGRLLVDFADAGVLTEVDDQRRVRWELSMGSGRAYRATFVPTLYP